MCLKYLMKETQVMTTKPDTQIDAAQLQELAEQLTALHLRGAALRAFGVKTEQRAIAAENRVIELGVENTNLKDEVAALKAKLSEAQINVG
jgi:hypothetical protein